MLSPGQQQRGTRFHNIYEFPMRTSSHIAASDNTASTSPTSSSVRTTSEDAPSYETVGTQYDMGETSWFADDDSKAPSMMSRASVATYGDSCQFDADDWFAQFHEDLDISDHFPTRETLDKAGEIPVYDAAGNSRAFRSLYSVGDVVGDRQLLIFIRHFYCGACQAYIKAIVDSISTQDYFRMAIPTSIIVIGCGSPELIRQYKARTSCPFPIFADPTREIFKLLGMNITMRMFGQRPEYMKEISIPEWWGKQGKDMLTQKSFKKKFQGGNLFQIGGEFLFQDGQVVWCHRMKNYRGHAEVDKVRRILEIEV